MGADYYTVLAGSANCWPYWVAGADVDGIDQFLWLTRETITCAAGTGLENCKVLKEIECNASKLTRLALPDTSICVPLIQWEDI